MISITQSSNSTSTLLTLTNTFHGNTKKRLVFVIDVSGSMQGERINLVLHALKVIVSASNENIEISIFTFDSDVKQIQTFTEMNDQNKLEMLEKIPNIPLTFGSTNLLDGINEPLKYIESVNKLEIDTHILVFTDGEPNIKDVREYSKILDKYYSDSLLSNVIIDIFGFGKSLNQEIISHIYQKGKGVFGFISDPNMLATVFNNYIANLFSTSLKNILLSYETEDTCSIEHIEIGDMMQEQKRHILLPYKSISYASISYNGQIDRYETIPIVQETPLKFAFHELRYRLLSVMESLNIRILETLHREFSLRLSDYSPTLPDYTKLKNLLDDMIHQDPNKGQIEKALHNYQSWGKYYLMSLYQAHKSEITINFKDESIQDYSGPIASAMALQLNNIFVSIPLVMTYGQTQSRYSYQPSRSASSYVSQSAGCFLGSCKIGVSRNGIEELIRLDELISGDILYHFDSKLVVKHILKSEISNQETLFKYNNLIGTRNHPIQIDEDKWIPMELIGDKWFLDNNQETYYVYTISVYDLSNDKYIDNFILENIKCSTIGHGYLDNPDDNTNILRSTFWGKTIIEIFDKICPEHNLLTLNLGKYHFMRDLGTGWIYDLFMEE